MIETNKNIIIFDIDGTLLEPHELETEIYIKAFKICYGIDNINSDWDIYKNRTDIEVAREILEKYWNRPCTSIEIDHFIQTYVNTYRKEFLDKTTDLNLIPGITRFLMEIHKNKNTMLAIATANIANIAKLRLIKAKIWHYFKFGGFAEDGRNKTEILGKALTLAKLYSPGIQNENIVYFGDHPNDTKAANVHGIKFIGIANSSKRRIRLESQTESPIFDNYDNYSEIFTHINL